MNFTKRFVFLIQFSYLRRKENQSAIERYKLELIIAYAIPFAIVLLTGIVEASAPRCSLWKPRFTEESCFFAGMYINIKYQTLFLPNDSHKGPFVN